MPDCVPAKVPVIDLYKSLYPIVFIKIYKKWGEKRILKCKNFLNKI